MQSYRELIFSRQVNYKEETFNIRLAASVQRQPLLADSSLAEKHDTETYSLLTVAFIPPRQEDVNACIEKTGLEA